MPSPSNMELRSGAVTVQPGQDEDQPRSEVEILREQLERANLDSDAELQRRRELEVQLDEAQTLRGRDQPAPVPVRIPIPPLDKYDGTTPITEWWETFLAFISLHNTPEPNAIAMLPFYLLGVALQFFNHLEPPCKSSLTRIRDALFERFKPSIPISQRLMKIQQETGETVDNYMFRVRKLSVECTMEEEVVTYFAREGLIDQLRLIVAPQNPKTLEDLRKMATLAEQATTKNPATQSTDIESAVSESIRMGIAAIKSSMMAPAEEKMAPVNALFEPRESPKPRTNYGRQQRASNPGPCSRCGEMENPEMASESSESMENNSQPFYEEIEVKMINKRELGRLQLKFVGNEGVDTDGTKAMRRKLIQTCIDFLKEKAESVWKNAEMSMYDSEFNAIVLRSGTARYSFVCYADEFGEPKITDVSQRRCEII